MNFLATATVPQDITDMLANLGAVNTAVAAVAGVVILTWLGFRLAKRAGR